MSGLEIGTYVGGGLLLVGFAIAIGFADVERDLNDNRPFTRKEAFSFFGSFVCALGALIVVIFGVSWWAQ